VHEEEKEWKERFKEVLRKEQELAGLADTLASKMAATEVCYVAQCTADAHPHSQPGRPAKLGAFWYLTCHCF